MKITITALFVWHHNNKLIGVMTVHVDDFLCAGTDLFYLNIISKLRETFFVGREEIVISISWFEHSVREISHCN